jgi:hypothetical protein
MTLTAPEVTALTIRITGQQMGRLATMDKTTARFFRALSARIGEHRSALGVEVLDAADGPSAHARLEAILAEADRQDAPVEDTPVTATAPTATGKTLSKNAVMLEMVRDQAGATEAEICSRLGWKACRATLGRVVQKSGLALRSAKDEATGRNRYFAA